MSTDDSPKVGHQPAAVAKSPASVSEHQHDDDEQEQKQHAQLSDDSGVAEDHDDNSDNRIYDDYDDEDEEEMEIYGLVEGQTPNRSMSIGGGAESLVSDDEHGDHPHGGGGGIWRNTSADDYEYDYIDEDGIFVPGGRHRGAGGGIWGHHCRGTRSLLYSPKLLCLIAAFLVVSLLAIFLPDQPQETQDQPVVRKYKGAPQYSCPAPDTVDETTTAAATASGGSSSSSNNFVIPKYQNSSEFMLDLANNLTTYTQAFRDLEFRDWNKTYREVKESLVHWKTSRFVPNLKTGDSLFESGCGIGLGLLMTLEILQEQNKNLRDLHLYGSDVSAAATSAGNVVLDKILGADVGGGKRGVLCAADSTRLDFIPSDTFDLVFSSRVAPLPDPFGMMDGSKNVTADVVSERRREVCQTLLTDWKSAALQRVAQERQIEWYGRWVSELVRIAKPGAPVAVEQVSDPYCDEHLMDEWGMGVPYSFWNDAVKAYGWDVDPESIQFDMDTLFPSKHRYHVFMRKNRH